MVVKKHLSLFMRKVGENADIAQVFADENDHLENFKSYLEKKNHKNGKKKLSKPYISSVLKTIRQFIKRLHTKRKIKELPRFLEEFKVKPIYRDFEPFTKEEITKLLENARPQLRAAILIALNTAALSIDIATLDYDMLDLKAGRIIRKRKKTEEEERVPEVNYILWDSTIRAIEIARSKRTKLVFLNRTKRPLNRNWLENGKYTRYDSLTQQFLSLTRKLEMPPGKTFKLLRKTSADMMADLEDVIFTERLLGHAPSTMALKHYAKKPFSQDKFDAAIVKMGEKFGFKTDYNRLTAATKEILMNKPGQ
jgi:integrase